MKNLKNQKGITLVALVITIIVLLILAGVALSLVAGNEGILSKATTAVDETERASAKEQAELFVAEAVADFYEAKYVTKEALTADNDTVDEYITAEAATDGSTVDYTVSISNGDVTVNSKDATPRTIVTGTLSNGKITWDNN